MAVGQGCYNEAENSLRSALNPAEQFGPEDPRLLLTLEALSAVCSAQRKYAEAEPLHRRALAIREKALGAEHPDVAASLNNLAALFRAQGRAAEAEPLEARAKAIRVKRAGGEAPK